MSNNFGDIVFYGPVEVPLSGVKNGKGFVDKVDVIIGEKYGIRASKKVRKSLMHFYDEAIRPRKSMEKGTLAIPVVKTLVESGTPVVKRNPN